MSVTLREVIEAGGYDLTALDDLQWLLSTQDEYAELIEEAEELIEQLEQEADDES